MPVEWLEMKCSEIKKKACENDIALQINNNDITALIMKNKQIVMYINDLATNETII